MVKGWKKVGKLSVWNSKSSNRQVSVVAYRNVKGKIRWAAQTRTKILADNKTKKQAEQIAVRYMKEHPRG